MRFDRMYSVCYIVFKSVAKAYSYIYNSSMLRHTLKLFPRPTGPKSLDLKGVGESKYYPRSEQLMTRLFNRGEDSIKYSDARMASRRIRPGITNTPRDLGELPRTYVIKILVLNQPITAVSLWSILKQRDDVPLDSLTHLEQVFRMAQEQHWVYKEKNQSDGLFYFYIHSSKNQAVQEMLRIERQTLIQDQQVEHVDKNKEENEAMDAEIRHLQNTLITNLSLLLKHNDPAIKEMPYINSSGSIDFEWYKQ